MHWTQPNPNQHPKKRSTQTLWICPGLLGWRHPCQTWLVGPHRRNLQIFSFHSWLWLVSPNFKVVWRLGVVKEGFLRGKSPPTLLSCKSRSRYFPIVICSPRIARFLCPNLVSDSVFCCWITIRVFYVLFLSLEFQGFLGFLIGLIMCVLLKHWSVWESLKLKSCWLCGFWGLVLCRFGNF